MKLSSLIFTQNKGMSGAIVAVVLAVIAILAGAYIDLKFAPIDRPVATTTPVMEVPVTTKHYENEAYEYALDYPIILDISENQHKATNDFDGLIPESIFVGSFPEGYGKGTNLTSVSLIVGAKKVSKKMCFEEIYGNRVASSSPRISPTMVNIEDIEYSLVSVGDAGAGNFYATTRYSTMHGDLCYSISVVGHSFNDIAGYNEDHPDTSVKVYDQDALDRILDEVVQSFTFVKK